MSEHDDLGDDELHSRLVNRGVSDERATFLVQHRDDGPEATMIEKVLDGD